MRNSEDIDIDAEREAIRRLRDELFAQEPPDYFSDQQVQRRMCDVLVKALADSRRRGS